MAGRSPLRTRATRRAQSRRNEGLMTAHSGPSGNHRPALTTQWNLSSASSCAALATDGAAALDSQIALIAPRSATVLVEGETGVGKEIAARQIHAQSPRAARSFVPVDCTVFSTELMESQL